MIVEVGNVPDPARVEARASTPDRGTESLTTTDGGRRPGGAPGDRPIAGFVRASLLAYGIPAGLAAGITQTWFRGATFIAGGDIAPFIRTGLASEADSVWGHSITGAGGPSYEPVVRLPEIAAGSIADWLGISAQLAQRFFYTLLVVALAVSVVYFVRAFVDRAAPASVAGLLAFFNPYVLQQAPNPLPLAAIALMGAAGGLVVRAAKGARPPPWALAAVSVFTAYLALNIPLVAVFVGWVLALAVLATPLTGRGGTRRAFSFLLRALPLSLLLNLWWLVPFALTLAGGSGATLAVERDIDAWGWTHARLSIPNVLSLSGAWGWSYPEYFPYAAALDRMPWGVLKFAFPAMALLAPVVVTGRRPRSMLVLVGLIGVLVFLGKGVHEPFSGANRFLYEHVPGLWLLREPLAKVGPALVLCFAALAAVTLDRAVTLARDGPRLGRRLFATGVAVLAVGAAVYPHPLWTGQVIPGDRPLLPSMSVRVPNEWEEVAAFLNDRPSRGKVLVLPLADYYQVSTDWGYYGVDLVPKLLLRHPTIQVLPETYFGEQPPFAELLRGVEAALIAGDSPSVRPMLRALGVRYVVLREDLADVSLPLLPSRRFADPTRLQRGLQTVPGVRRVRTSSLADVYEVTGADVGLVGAATAVVDASDVRPGGLALAVASLPPGAVAGTGGRGEGQVAAVGPGSRRFEIHSPGGRYALIPRFLGPQPAEVEFDRRGDRTVVTVRPLTVVRVEGRKALTLTPRRFRIPDSASAFLALNGQPVPVPAGTAVVGLDRNSTLSVPAASAVSSFSEAGDCNAYDRRSPEEVGITATPLSGEPALAVRLGARDHSACVSAAVGGAVPGASHLVRFEHRTVRGQPARFCLWQDGPDRCADLPPLAPSGDWQHYEAVAVPEPGTTRFRLYLYADAAGGEPTVTEYRGASVHRMRSIGGEWTFKASDAGSVYLARGRRRAAVALGIDPHVSSFSEAGDCNAYDRRSPEEVGITSTSLRGEPALAVRLGARDHSACVDAAVRGFVPGAPHLVRFEHRTVRGQPARFCLWQDGPDRCADLPSLTPSADWERYEAVALPEPGTTRLRLYLYADAAGGGPTVTEYRGVEVEPWSPLALVALHMVGEPDPAPVVEWSRAGPASYRVEVGKTAGDFVLELRESFAPGWKLERLPEDRRVEHFRAHGYANGWRISGGEPFVATIHYTPNRWFGMAVIVSATAALAAAVLLAVRALRKRTRSGPWPEGGGIG